MKTYYPVVQITSDIFLAVHGRISYMYLLKVSDIPLLLSYHTVSIHQPGAEPFAVTQFHFTSWPDHGVPRDATSLLRFYRILMRRRRSGKHIIVHCRFVSTDFAEFSLTVGVNVKTLLCVGYAI